MTPELKKFLYAYLMNERVLGEETLELVMHMERNDSVVAKGVRQTFLSDILKTTPPRTSCLNTATETRERGEKALTYIDDGRAHKLFQLKEIVLGCRKCGLHKMRRNLVFGDGSIDSSLIFIGEAPGREEDERGVPFVGEAGRLLTTLLKSIGIDRISIYITNIIKCRPPGNRDPLPEEIDSCSDWLNVQLEIIAPKIICTLGRYATYFLIGRTPGLATTFSAVRGKTYDYKGTKVVPTYHPAALLYHPKWKVDTISDLKLVKELWNKVRNSYEKS